MTRRKTIAGLLALAVGALAPGAHADEPAAWVADSRAAAAALGGQLMQELGAALAVSPLEAIQVCKLRAPEISAGQGASLGATVGRTALRVRNPANAPSEWQRQVLESFATRMAAGEDPARIEYAALVEHDGSSERRWMKPIVTAELCVTCHGASIAAPLAAEIDAAYPEDQATGFEVGELRGAFYVVWREPLRQ